MHCTADGYADFCVSVFSKHCVRYEPSSGTDVSFSYKTFALDSYVNKTQKMVCQVTICGFGLPCAKATSDADCPNQPADMPLLYSVNGAV